MTRSNNFRAALLSAVEAIVQKDGIEAVTIRAAAKAIGVSHAAAFRHFADKEALLTAFATRCAGDLADYMEREAVGEKDARLAFYRTGVGYLRFALERSERCSGTRCLMSMTLATAPPCAAWRYHCLSGAPRAVDEGLPAAALLAWGATHGLATLAADGALNDLPPQTRSVEGLAEALALLGKLES